MMEGRSRKHISISKISKTSLYLLSPQLRYFAMLGFTALRQLRHLYSVEIQRCVPRAFERSVALI